jgi:polysaccharide export outer membrane protein/exopolysaccharide production protein ExoF
MMEQERTIFDARKDAITTQLRALTDLRIFLEKELLSLEKQLTFHDKQIELVQKELSGVSSLVQKGLVVAPRELSLERGVAQMQSDKLSAETSLLRARQELSKTDISILELRNRHANEVAENLRETQAQLNETTWKTDTAVQLLQETEIAAPALLNLRERVKPDYKIVRTTTSGTVELTAKETTPLEPGDTLKVEIKLPQLGLTALPSGNIPAVGSIAPPGTN